MWLQPCAGLPAALKPLVTMDPRNRIRSRSPPVYSSREACVANTHSGDAALSTPLPCFSLQTLCIMNTAPLIRTDSNSSP